KLFTTSVFSRSCLFSECKSLGKPDLNTTLPIRQTASIFKQPVTKVTNHPSNKVRSDPQRVTEQPRQLFWEKRLQGLSASDLFFIEFILILGVGPGNNDDTLLSAVASALHTSSAPITGQLSAAVEKNPAVWLNTSQPLCKAFIVTDDDIRLLELKEHLDNTLRHRVCFFGCSCVEPGVGLGDPCGSLPTWNVL
uniref:Uncharacterized protein n=1 Tax=Anas zonorhyncha TaxID=75864 RepID=A0A8B9VUD6_9AVES